MKLAALILDVLSAGFATAAAWLWLRSALVRIPKRINKIDAGHAGGVRDPDAPPRDDLDRLSDSLWMQTHVSSQAAICAGIAAVFQAALVIMAMFQTAAQ